MSFYFSNLILQFAGVKKIKIEIETRDAPMIIPSVDIRNGANLKVEKNIKEETKTGQANDQGLSYDNNAAYDNGRAIRTGEEVELQINNVGQQVTQGSVVITDKIPEGLEFVTDSVQVTSKNGVAIANLPADFFEIQDQTLIFRPVTNTTGIYGMRAYGNFAGFGYDDPLGTYGKYTTDSSALPAGVAKDDVSGLKITYKVRGKSGTKDLFNNKDLMTTYTQPKVSFKSLWSQVEKENYGPITAFSIGTNEKPLIKLGNEDANEGTTTLEIQQGDIKEFNAKLSARNNSKGWDYENNLRNISIETIAIVKNENGETVPIAQAVSTPGEYKVYYVSKDADSNYSDVIAENANPGAQSTAEEHDGGQYYNYVFANLVVKKIPDNEQYEPGVGSIVVPEGTEITEEDVKNKVFIPEESGGKITNVGTIPNTDEAGDKGTVSVTVEYPDGTTDIVEVPVKVTDIPDVPTTPDNEKYQPGVGNIIVPKGTTITEDDVKNKVTIPEGSNGKIIQVGAIPTTDEVGERGTVLVTVEYPDGTRDIVEVPITVTDVPDVPVTPDNEKYQPGAGSIEVSKGTPITEEDIKNKVTIPEESGGKITNVGTIPNTDEPGDKGTVSVTVEYPDGTTDIVEVPITVIDIPSVPDNEKYQPGVGNIIVPKGTPITEETIRGKVTVPSGSNGVITSIGTIPDTTEAGQKTPVSVVVTYPDGTTDVVEVPIFVTEIPDVPPVPDNEKYQPGVGSIEVPKGTPITEADVMGRITIPAGSGGVVTSVGTIPDTTEAGQKPSVSVVITYPDGTTDVVEVPVTVTDIPEMPDNEKYKPGVGSIEVPQGTVITEEDIKNQVTIPEGSGGKIVSVGTIPPTDEAGDKGTVMVVVEYPDGTRDIVEVPVTVTDMPAVPDNEKYQPGVEVIEVPQGTVITEEDIKNKVTIPEESGGKIVQIGTIPTTEEPGDKGKVSVTVEYPDGTRDIVEVPVTVLEGIKIPDNEKYQPEVGKIEVPQGTVITEEDVKNKVTIPEGSGGKIISIGVIPSTDIPGEKQAILVTVEYPDGTRDIVEVPVTVLETSTDDSSDSNDNQSSNTDTNDSSAGNDSYSGSGEMNSGGTRYLPFTGETSNTLLGAIGVALGSVAFWLKKSFKKE